MIELTTQCPQCKHQFIVTLQQLQQRKGVSRCPQCAFIFDAYDQAAQSESNQSVSASPQVDLSTDFKADAHEPAGKINTSVHGNGAAISQISPAAHQDSLGADNSTLRWHFIGKEPLDVGVADAPTPGTQFSISGLTVPANQEAVDDIRVYLNKNEPHLGGPHATESIAVSSYDGRPERSTAYAYRAKRGSHPIWGAVLFLLLFLALAQLVYVYRVQIANSVKLTRPLLEMMCEIVHCDLPYMREINAIDITQSALKQQPSSTQSPSSYTYLLQLQMQNTLAWDQEWPTLVLSFSDAAAAVLATISVPPEQYLAPSQRSRPFEAGAKITIRLPITVANKKINGFTVDKYYP